MPYIWQLVSLLSLLPRAFCDLPVHCLRHQIVGEWEFSLGAPSKQRSSCGHQRPDVEGVQPYGIDAPTSKKRITLLEPNIAKSSTGSTGTYTMVYDEGFEVQIDGQIYFAFSKFDLAGKGQTNTTENAKRSHCGETARGWYRDESRTTWGCYAATKVHQSMSLLSIAPAPKPFSEDYDKPITLASHSRRAHQINMMQLSWTARVYNRFVGKSLRELNSYAGIRRSISRQTAAAGLPRRNVLLEIGTDSCPELPITKRSKQGDILSHLLVKGQKPLKPCQLKRQLQTFEQPPDKMVEEVEKSLPREFDWRKARGGRNFLEPVMDQADCGSCYAVSTMRMLTARHKVKTNNTNAEPWSISFPLHCGEYTQGCNGGYGFLVSKWSEDVGLIPASCAPYNTSGTCHSTCDPKTMKKRYRAANHHLVGGFYGNSSSVPMMLELFNHGPLVVSFEPTDDFMMYSGGIFSQLELSVPAPLVKHNSEWQKVDHAVLLIGWGEENGQKYWMVQNSWGADWGEAGYFRISRDNNECGVESQAEGAEVVEDDHPEVLVDFVQQLP
mmetsp:Transcript_111078/g.175081  ORF Transcript_111078/g.175081 Transcript_111078/m.175081 type:complete len:554 (-) Transcript_111078:88-1749(-)|eukprot:CAMPEP_0169098514 /NCGR_PEP_ID=MMETSP1015-20121227/20080_1 /TAXON_ID=342587 /ORGANISM="Karlodinium micrum, Strain CCMP2283" /LENGTH=553 /DNA_ID=CAMNT_0009159365 /DNA_START=59 /DNA_END=1720 /DNA_ORIENTATION=-